MQPDIIIPAEICSYVQGQFIQPADQQTLPVINPATEEQLSLLYEADAHEVDLAVKAARASFDSGVWSRQSTDRRQATLLRVRDLIFKHAEELATLECLNTGIPYLQLKKLHVPGAGVQFQFHSEAASQLKGELHQQRSGYQIQVSREPAGVAALISPWNGPINLSCTKIAAAIAYGNSCVLKPSEFTPLAFKKLMEIFKEAGIPDGVINMVNGRGAVTGAALVEHRDVDLVSFTGGGTSGKTVNSIAAQGMKRTTMELGGKSANIILESADLEVALDGALASIFMANGQQCLAGSRILVQKSIAREFINKFIERARAVQIGDPFDPATELGPLAYRAHMNKVLDFVKIATDEGAVLHCGGGRTAGLDKGLYIDPIVVEASSNDMRICQEEVFGPFATFLEFETLDEAIDIANDSEYGLVSYLWSNDLAAVTKAIREIRVGTIWVNTTLVGDPRAPFGGVKESGTGREGGIGSVEFYTELKSVVIPTGGSAPVAKIGVIK